MLTMMMYIVSGRCRYVFASNFAKYQILTDFQNSFTDRLNSKFVVKP